MVSNFSELKSFLDAKVELYNNLDFINDDPVCIPHLFSKKQDIEIAGFFAAIFAWGQRKTIISKCKLLIELMDNAPYDFIVNHEEKDLVRFLNFKHRTFNATDLLYFIHFFTDYYSKNDSLENAFSQFISNDDIHVQKGLEGFNRLFFSLNDAPQRTHKHIASPTKNSSCKRLNMFLRWMVRKDKNGVDFGIWCNIKPAQLLCPLDVHVNRVARKLSLVETPQSNWKAVLELTDNLRQLDPNDPAKYDYALFGLGIIEHF